MKLSDLNSGDERPIEVELRTGAALAVRYVPERITGTDVQALAEDVGITPMKLATILTQCMTWWDVQADDSGEMLPIEVGNLLPLGLPVLGRIYRAIEKDQQPSGEASGSFGSG